MKTIADMWHDYERTVLPANASRIQRSETRRAFYCGFEACLQLYNDMADESGDNDELGMQMIKALHIECSAFAHAVARDEA
jgi:hypothetical protein